MIGTASANIPGDSAVLQSIATTGVAPGDYQFVVDGLNSTTGIYQLTVALNAAFELEGTSSLGNDDSIATAQDLDVSALGLGGGSSQLAVNGTPGVGADGVDVTFDSGDLPSSFSTYSSNNNGTVDVEPPSGSYNSTDNALILKSISSSSTLDTLNEAIQTVDLSGLSQAVLRFSHRQITSSTATLPATFTGHYNGTGVAISADGLTWYTVYTANVHESFSRDSVIDLAAAAGAAGIKLGPGFKIKYQEFGHSANTGFDSISISDADPDYYRIQLNAGDDVTIAGASSGTLRLELHDLADHALAIAQPGTASNVLTISRFVAPKSGYYYIVATGTFAVPYNVLVTKNAAFDTEPNNSSASAEDLGTVHAVLGAVQASSPTVKVGYFTDGNPSHTSLSGPIVTAGYVPIQITDISTFDLSSIDILVINTSDDLESDYSAALLGRVPDIEAWVYSGGVFVANDGLITARTDNPFLFGIPQSVTRHGNESDLRAVSTSSTLVTNGPFGTVSSLEAGSYVAGGYIERWSLPTDVLPIFNDQGVNDRVTALSYSFGSGGVYYSTVALDGLLEDNNVLYKYFKTQYAPNLLSYANSLRSSSNEDWFALDVTTSLSPVRVQTQTPLEGNVNFAYRFDPHIELYDSTGSLVAVGTPTPDGRNEFLNYQPGVQGRYYLRVTGEHSTSGEYLLSINAVEKGDVNRDGLVNNDDLRAILSAMTDVNLFQANYGLSANDVETIADINGDGAVNNLDLQALIDLLHNTMTASGNSSASTSAVEAGSSVSTARSLTTPAQSDSALIQQQTARPYIVSEINRNGATEIVTVPANRVFGPTVNAPGVTEAGIRSVRPEIDERVSQSPTCEFD